MATSTTTFGTIMLPRHYKKLEVENPEEIVVAVFINRKKVGEVHAVQHDPFDLKRFFGEIPTNEQGGRIRFGIYGNRSAESDNIVYFDLVANSGAELGRDYLRSAPFPINSAGDWKTFTQVFQTPDRPSFPGEPYLPGSTLKVTLKLVSGPRLLEQ